MRPDGAAPLDDVIRALGQKSKRWSGLDASTVEEVVRHSLRDGCPRFEFLRDDQGQPMIRATGKHTFEASAIERQQEKVSRALVKYCRKSKNGAWVPEAELVAVAQRVDASFDQPEVLSILRTATHNCDDRLRFEEWSDDSGRYFSATGTSKSPRYPTNPSWDHPGGSWDHPGGWSSCSCEWYSFW